MPDRPRVTREYNGALLDSTYWNRFTPRAGDIVISTSMKAGTTWMQRICAALVFQTPDLEQPVDATSPWIDMRNSHPGLVGPVLEAQTHRRFLKSHLPLDATPYYDEIKYIVVGRDARDVFMSMVAHHANVSPKLFETMNARNAEDFVAANRRVGLEAGPEEEKIILHDRRPWEGEDYPPLEGLDIREMWRLWMTRSPYPWESDGYPYWSHLYHLDSWWKFRHLHNILFVHYTDMLRDLDGQMRRISAYLDIPVNESVWPSLVDSATFETMKRQHEKTAPAVTHSVWKDSKNFFHRGKNGRWRDVLSDDDLQLYDDRKQQALAPDAIRWLEEGGLVAGYPGE
jgi:aryl sulfotransferase